MEERDKSVVIQEQVEDARRLFESGITLSYEARISILRRLKRIIVANKEQILGALHSDLHKSRYEGYMTEYALVLSELDYTIKKLRSWMRPKRMQASLAQFVSTVRLHHVPYGVVLVMSPWNYPFQLSMMPLIGAIAAGNVVVFKPSAYSAALSELFAEMFNTEFKEGVIRVVTGSRKENQALLEQEFDYVFFTGSPVVGSLVMEACAKHLTPFTLELGGKSPCIVDKTADLKKTAKRILFGKLLNSGQTCVAPDYLLIHEDVYDDFVPILVDTYTSMMNEGYRRENFPCIINEKHFERIDGLVKGSPVYYQDSFDPELPRLYPFTLLERVSMSDPVMQEEIFGPVFPMLKWKELADLKAIIREHKNPLALYCFTKDQALADRVVKEIPFGGGCINDTIMHIASHHQPFGGVGRSGIGSYHGHYSFETFSHQKNVVRKWWYLDLPVRYHPYKNPDKHLPYFMLK